ncbi:MAG: glutathione S-transferase family protein [Rhodobacteraceae bacterium]|jgi:glutathione S-transferase|nr:glutathione S-transferase family protein [Paracoccaceae bacterium]MBL4557482.1 glutathione S-transferase family protein [Paracoccaceae bacterium]HBH00012.1 glutathione S-transferase [Paracoccaceae bacterium]
MIRLYHSLLSPFCRKVRLVLGEKKIEAELIEERYWERRADFIRMNPTGKVPVLRDGAVTLGDSQAICEYLEETRPNPALLPGDPAERAEIRRLVFLFDDTFHHTVTSKLLYERVHKKVMGLGTPDSRNVKSGAQKIKAHLDYMNGLLEQRRWLAGERLTLADFAAAAHLSCLDYISDVAWDRAPAVREWYALIKSRPSFRPLLADQIPGFPQPTHYADLDF